MAIQARKLGSKFVLSLLLLTLHANLRAESLPRPGQRTEPTVRGKTLQETWLQFARAVVKNDVATIKALSAKRIRCPECLQNTAEEEKALARLRETKPDTWEADVSERLAYLSIDAFIRQDAPLIFTKQAKARLLDKTKLKFGDTEILVTLIDPTGTFEGMQGVFIFAKTTKGYQFCGYSTVP